MTLQARTYEVGVRALHDRLSEHLEHVQGGAEVLVTRRGRPIARLSAVKESDDPLQDLVRRGLVTPPNRQRTARRAQVKARGPVSELVAEQRR
jgi:prevent-host-death family protein